MRCLRHWNSLGLVPGPYQRPVRNSIWASANPVEHISNRSSRCQWNVAAALIRFPNRRLPLLRCRISPVSNRAARPGSPSRKAISPPTPPGLLRVNSFGQGLPVSWDNSHPHQLAFSWGWRQARYSSFSEKTMMKLMGRFHGLY
jgi:hypothetical protein